MRNTQIQQFSNRRRRRGLFGCAALGFGLMLCAVFAIILLLPVLNVVGLRIAGFDPIGRTEAVLASESAVRQILGGGGGGQNISPSARFAQAAQNGSQPPSIFANAGQLGTFTFTPDEANMAVSTGASGQTALVMNITEAQALSMCAQRSSVCAGGNDRARNLTVEFKPGGAIIYADVQIPGAGIWQRAGGVIHFNNATKRFEVVGVDVNGTLYQTPEEILGRSVNDLVNEANRVLQGVTLTANGTNFRLSEVSMGDGEMTLILR